MWVHTQLFPVSLIGITSWPVMRLHQPGMQQQHGGPDAADVGESRQIPPTPIPKTIRHGFQTSAGPSRVWGLISDHMKGQRRAAAAGGVPFFSSSSLLPLLGPPSYSLRPFTDTCSCASGPRLGDEPHRILAPEELIADK